MICSERNVIGLVFKAVVLQKNMRLLKPLFRIVHQSK